jgi:hypothetical protein
MILAWTFPMQSQETLDACVTHLSHSHSPCAQPQDHQYVNEDRSGHRPDKKALLLSKIWHLQTSARETSCSSLPQVAPDNLPDKTPLNEVSGFHLLLLTVFYRQSLQHLQLVPCFSLRHWISRKWPRGKVMAAGISWVFNSLGGCPCLQKTATPNPLHLSWMHLYLRDPQCLQTRSVCPMHLIFMVTVRFYLRDLWAKLVFHVKYNIFIVFCSF